MKKKAQFEVTNCAVNGSMNAYLALSCEYQGNRFHVWIDKDTAEISGPLYKNPPLGTKTTDPAYFHTRTLELDGATGRVVVLAMLKALKEQRLIDRWQEQIRKQEAEAASRRAEEARQARIHATSPRLLAALESVYLELTGQTSGETGACEPGDILEQVEAALIEAGSAVVNSEHLAGVHAAASNVGNALSALA